MIGNNVGMAIGDEVAEIKNLLSQLESWASDLLQSDWRDIECSGSAAREWYERESNKVFERNYERFLVIEKLREKLLCE